MSARRRTVTLCGEPLHGLQHICAFFDSREEQYDILNPYFQEGLDTGDEVVTIVESSYHGEHMRRMTEGGVAVARGMGSGQLKVLSSEETYIQDSVFVVERMYAMLEQVLENALAGPYKSVRTMGDMEWALKNLPGTDELMVYEARVNQLTPHHDCTLLCAYDVSRFSGRTIADVLATHSHVIINGRVHENPYFVDPVVYLHKLALRKGVESPARHAH
ncbi:MAG TPA: MEDS domain-containing protein [Ramlibacter sp.]|uniref:MEDS domain-containing protein n=1 Tax=Ramlibacter sp. TaxID=1917967 RepID=UPI002CD1B239|nr:MEDS domain-containing protein [Ramlibacter sp.]HVZ44055.1 MEDS domain-containing protein [Ramlibacter sp.]